MVPEPLVFKYWSIKYLNGKGSRAIPVTNADPVGCVIAGLKPDNAKKFAPSELAITERVPVGVPV